MRRTTLLLTLLLVAGSAAAQQWHQQYDWQRELDRQEQEEYQREMLRLQQEQLDRLDRIESDAEFRELQRRLREPLPYDPYYDW